MLTGLKQIGSSASADWKQGQQLDAHSGALQHRRLAQAKVCSLAGWGQLARQAAASQAEVCRTQEVGRQVWMQVCCGVD